MCPKHETSPSTQIQALQSEIAALHREREIEVSMESVRTASMAMHKSSDLFQAAEVLFKQIQRLGAKVFSCGFALCEHDTSIVKQWMYAIPVEVFNIHHIDHAKERVHHNIYKAWKDQKPLHAEWVKGKTMDDMVQFLMTEPSIKKNMERIASTDIEFPKQQKLHGVPFSQGYLLVITTEDFPETEIFIRFAKVFEQTYTRYLDLQKAETQAREAQIEASLERVRARTMWMQQSHELRDVVTVMYDEMESLGLAKWGCQIMLCHKDKEEFELWLAEETDSNEKSNYFIKGKEHPIYRNIWESWENQTDSFTLHHRDEYKLAFDKYWLEETDFKNLPDEFKASVYDRNEVYLHFAPMKHGLLNSITYEKPSDNLLTTLTRFAKVFEQTYTRFLDLQKAEAQAKEAQIEAALERVRAASMAMHASEDLGKVVAQVYKEFTTLNIELTRCFIVIYEEKTLTSEWYMAHMESDAITQGAKIPFNQLPLFKSYAKGWLNREAGWQHRLEGKEKVKTDDYLFTKTELKHLPTEVKDGMMTPSEVILSGCFHDYGGIIHGGVNTLSPDNHDLLNRFSQVFNYSYARYLDIKKAETQAREAQIEAALERVRARAMSMHTSDELSEAAELLYKEFNRLEITPYSCGYVINDEEKGHWNVWMTDANDDSFKDFWTLPFDADRHLQERYASWKSKDLFHEAILVGEENKIHHQRIAEFAPWKAKALDNLPGQLVLSCAHFDQGHLMIITGDSLSAEIKEVLIRFAKVFEQTYTRFLDLKRAEVQAQLIKEEKERLEVTLNDLKATQTQLIQAEKMASLGELTAGIAHEIQNPLNFVNNFSDVSGELIDEALELMDTTRFDAKGSGPRRPLSEQNMTETKEILNDLKGNLEKISHHGGRASSIVKGMLDHSRAGSDEKTPTDINALCDEYLRLSYHGLRAKDKSFNSDFETHFDESLPLIDVVPQDIGRVLLNILNNAFYSVSSKALATEDVVNEKANAQPTDASVSSGLTSSRRNVRESKGNPAQDVTFKPLVTITTRSVAIPPSGGQGASEAIEITISDNGIGMSQETIDKVFQPFFTTKPTGQGTGLGMSISYDIVTKGHGGELSVESVAGEGTSFIIKFPSSA